VELDSLHEPSWEDMISLPAQAQDKWIAAPKEEITNMQQQNVWTLIELPPGRKAITSKWLFKTQFYSIGQVRTYKPRLVTRGISQHCGEDYDQTFLYQS
jgi:hypothetical protein